MALVSLNVQAFYSKEVSHGPQRHAYFAKFMARRLRALARTLGDNGLYFEASSGEELARTFEAISGDCAEGRFDVAWGEFEDWGGQIVEWNGKSVTLCKVPHLPDRFAC